MIGMKLDSTETLKVQQAYANINTSLDALVTTCTPADTTKLAGVKIVDNQYYMSRFREAVDQKEAFNGRDSNDKLKYHGWDWHPGTWTLVMKTLGEGYARLDKIIKQDAHLTQAVEDFIELCITKYELCVTDMQEYERLWTKEIMPRQEVQKKAWKSNPLLPAVLNPYGPTTLKAKLAALKALVSTSSP
jgi:hypothetical protein